MEKELIITTEAAYQETMIAMYELMERGEEDLTPAEIEQLKQMTAAAEKYENDYL
jgi:HTH-type transcriptional regulator/antitoxin HigA